MARGWESKSVESQIESAEQERKSPKERMNPAQIETLRRKESLELSRKRVLHLIENTQNPRYRTQLEKELAVLNARMALLAD